MEGDAPIEIRIRDAISTDIDSKTNTLILAQYGTEEESGEGYKILSLHSKGSQSFTYGIRNEGTNPIDFTLDLSESENMTFSSKEGMIKKQVKPGQIEFLIHAQGGSGNFNKVLKHSSVEVASKK